MIVTKPTLKTPIQTKESRTQRNKTYQLELKVPKHEAPNNSLKNKTDASQTQCKLYYYYNRFNAAEDFLIFNLIKVYKKSSKTISTLLHRSFDTIERRKTQLLGLDKESRQKITDEVEADFLNSSCRNVEIYQKKAELRYFKTTPSDFYIDSKLRELIFMKQFSNQIFDRIVRES